jgi:modulator of FtsH protease HflK
MAWNQPGGDNGDRDPWGGGGRNGQQGPPDLDEVLGKLQGKLGNMFGGGGSGGGGVSIGGGGVSLIIGILAVGWALMGVYIVEPAEQGVVTRFGAYNRTENSGPHWAPAFIEKVELVNVEMVRSAQIGFRNLPGQGSVENESLMLTQDENIVDLQFAVQYRVKNAADFLFNVRDPDVTLSQATESAVREIVGKREMDFVLTEGRSAVSDEARTLIQTILDRYQAGLDVMSLNTQTSQPPQPVQAAFADVVKAREDKQRTINLAGAYKADIVPKAEGEASAIRERALAYRDRVVAASQGESERFLKVLTEYEKAPDITRQRLYIETVESVLANNNKVMVDVEGGNNLMYLPLDKIMGQSRNSVAGGSVGSGPNVADTVGASSRSAMEDLRRSRGNLRGRDR